MWSHSPAFKPCVQQHWSKEWQGTKMFSLVKKLKSLKWPLKMLNKDDFNDVENNAARARISLEYIQDKLRSDPQNSDFIHQEIDTANSVRFLDRACHEFLLQKSKATWVEKGDQNSKYFHSIIKSRQVRNTVVRIENVKGVTWEDTMEIQGAFLEFYKSLLGATTSTTAISQNVVQLGKVCSSEHCSMLMAPVTSKEIK
ncbi:uncharacterized protein LOC141631010 [Silene latifolia]|uniref:uncharacterized protein LOC141631010 n=1 Tax=Silene latifolia TaxID=37657 RepID=UPI003D785A5D